MGAHGLEVTVCSSRLVHLLLLHVTSDGHFTALGLSQTSLLFERRWLILYTRSSRRRLRDLGVSASRGLSLGLSLELSKIGAEGWLS